MALESITSFLVGTRKSKIRLSKIFIFGLLKMRRIFQIQIFEIRLSKFDCSKFSKSSFQNSIFFQISIFRNSAFQVLDLRDLSLKFSKLRIFHIRLIKSRLLGYPIEHPKMRKILKILSSKIWKLNFCKKVLLHDRKSSLIWSTTKVNK